ncbi:MAG: hypothetical protein F6K19_43610 [Cyanothece sp. SIO1E1]|nr:hypothetical protein [Cyanothece sp. SIO1E1]
MTYRDQLHPWCIIRQLPKLQNITVARCCRRHEAAAHLRILHQLIPAASFVIIFDVLPATNQARSQPSVMSKVP